MDKLNLQHLTQWTAVGFSGLFAGGAFFINAVDIPAIEKVKDTAAVRLYWAGMYNRAKRTQGAFAILSSAAGLYAWHQSDSEYRKLFLIGAIAIASVMPFTALVMSSDIKKLLEDDVIEKRGESWVREKISVWNRRHMVRTLLSVLATDIMTLGIFLTR